MARRYDMLGERLWTSECVTDDILLAAAACYEEHGVRGTSIRNVAARASVAPTTVLHRFRSPTKLADAVFPELPRLRFDWWPPTRGDARKILTDLFELWASARKFYVATLADAGEFPSVRTLHAKFERYANLAVTHAFVGRSSPEEEALHPSLAPVRAIVRLPGWYALRDAGIDDDGIVGLAVRLAALDRAGSSA